MEDTSNNTTKENTSSEISNKCNDESGELNFTSEEISTQQTSETNIKKINDIICSICKNKATKKQKTLSCHNCGGLVHFQCSSLPPYMVYTLSTSTKRFVCEKCVDIPENFMEKKRTDHINANTERQDNIQILLEKYDFQNIAENLLQLCNKMEATSRQMNENIGSMRKQQKCKEEVDKSSELDNHGHNDQIEQTQKECASYKHSYELLSDEINGKYAEIKSLENLIEKLTENIKEKENIIRKTCDEEESKNDKIKKEMEGKK